MKYTYLVMFIFISSLKGGIVPSPDFCPVINIDEFNHYATQKVDVKLPEKFKIGKNDINIMLSNPKFPSGYMVTAYLDLLEFEAKEPEIEDGYPLSTIEIFEKGKYTVELKINLIYKGS
mgnify:CR=1 FL=1